MAIYTATSLTELFSPPLWQNLPNAKDGNFSTFALWSFSTTNDSNTIKFVLNAGFDSASNGEQVRVVKAVWALTATGISATRRGKLLQGLYVNGVLQGGSHTTVVDEFGNDVTWFGTNYSGRGTIAIAVPGSALSENVVLEIKGESPGDNRGFINNRTILFSLYEVFIDTTQQTAARLITMMLPQGS